MKRAWIMALATCLMAVLLSACTGTADTPTPEESAAGTTTVPTTTAFSTATTAGTTIAPVADTVEAYVAMNQAMVESLQQVMKDQGMSVSLKANGNDLVYEYVYNSPVENVLVLRSSLEQMTISQDETNYGLLTTIRQECPAVEGLVFRYLNTDGTEIFTKEYR